jgi:hypothetical protein
MINVAPGAQTPGRRSPGYSLHVVLRTPEVWPPEEPGAYGWHVLVLLVIGAVYVALGRRGPLERAVGLPLDTLRVAARRHAPLDAR